MEHLISKKGTLVALALGLGLAALPLGTVYAAGLNAVSSPTATPSAGQGRNQRLQNLWSREQQLYQREGDVLSKTGALIPKAQALINKASAKGWDTSALQAALNAFQTAVENAQTANAGGASLIATHAGFDGNGNVVDPSQALATVKALGQVLKDTRSAMDGTGKALRQAIQDFRNAHKATATPAPVTP